jgi:hypothetical protein
MILHALASLMLAIQPEPAQPLPGKALGPEQALAVRLEQERLAQHVIPTVVIVEDAVSFAAAIAGWDGSTRYPVLWDDGTVRARADIARFVRGFGPELVVRFEASGDWPRDRAGKIAWIERSLYAAVFHGQMPDSMGGFVEQLREAKVPLVGLVLADPDDAGWAGSLMLAAGHYQPIGFTASPGRMSARLTSDQVGLLEGFTRRFAEAVGLAWRGAIDDVDAVTIGFDCPVKVQVATGPNKFLATTDVLGRVEPGATVRWAWTGQLDASSEARSAYMAACSLFLADKSAWIFDSYSDAQTWNKYDGTLTGQKLEGLGWTTTVYDKPRQDLTIWRAATARAVDAGLILVNTMGNADFFRLVDKDASPGDVPMLTRPAGVYFVHSFSAARAGSVDTVGGRWLEHGAYAYLGSVQEPGLSAFVETPTVAERLAGGFPFGVSVRRRVGPGKLAVIGDPLATFHATGARVEGGAVPLEGLEDVEAMARAATKDRRFGDAVGLFALIGDDASAVRLARGVLNDRPESFNAKLAKAALLPLFRKGRPDEVVACFQRLSPRDRKEPLLLDALWHAGRLRVYADREVLSVLRQNLRPGQAAEDAIELAGPWAHLNSSSSAVGMLQSVRATTKNPRDLRRLDKKIKAMLRGG